MHTCILGIETSCDDTSAAIWYNYKILANITANQEVHKDFGGVFPEKASRAHQVHIVPVVEAALKKAGIQKEELSGIAVTKGPGLIGSLMVGVSFAKSLAYALDIPVLPVHHMQAHIHAHFIDNPKPKFPFICLTVSGGHTQIVLVEDYLKMKIIGQTLDDAAGEAFDKTAKMLGLTYPGGPEIDRLAQAGDPYKYPFPKPRAKDYHFSFSGLKTAILYFLRDQEKLQPDFKTKHIEDVCASVQYTIVNYLLSQLKTACIDYGITEVAIAGGVSANSFLRRQFKELGEEMRWNTFIPEFQYCTDNGAMIAQSGFYLFEQKQFATQELVAEARLPFPV